MESSVFLFRHECANFYIKSCYILLAATVLNGEMCIWTIFFPYNKGVFFIHVLKIVHCYFYVVLTCYIVLECILFG